MLVKLWVENYATYGGFVNGTNGIFKASKMTYCDKIIIWIMFQICKIETLTKKNIVITTTLSQNEHHLNLSTKI
jgi:hypothetical protein